MRAMLIQKRVLVIFFLILVMLHLMAPVSAFSFSFGAPFNNNSRILVGGNATKTHRSLRLTSNGRDEAGRAVYAKPIRLVDTSAGTVASFSTSFTFRITQFATPGDGLTFLITSGDQYPPEGSQGEHLGLVSPNGQASNHFLAVEFDTYMNSGDPPGNHVGIDLNSLTSLAVAKVEGKLSFHNTTLTSWIDYNSSSGILEVRLAKRHARRPVHPLLSHTVRLDQKIFQDKVHVGFSAATGGWGAEIHRVFAWNFSLNGFNTPAFPPDSPAPAPAPAPMGYTDPSAPASSLSPDLSPPAPPPPPPPPPPSSLSRPPQSDPATPPTAGGKLVAPHKSSHNAGLSSLARRNCEALAIALMCLFPMLMNTLK